jgi:uncharacterized membrane protein
MAARKEEAAAEAETAEQPRAKYRPSVAQVRTVSVGLAAGIISWGGVVLAVLLVVHIILVLGGANPGNSITTFVGSWSSAVVFGFKDLFTPSNAKVQVLVNYGLAAIFWLVVTVIASRVVRRLA